MFIRTLPTNLLQMFCEIFLSFLVIFKSIIDPDDHIYLGALSSVNMLRT